MRLSWLVVPMVVACDDPLAAGVEPTPEQPVPSSATTPARTGAVAARVEILMTPAGTEPVASILKRETERARAEGRSLLVYVGATWCEPCKRFHDAAVAGELDAVFPGLRLVEFDHDRDGTRLEAAGCTSQLIPLFARPTTEGTCDPERRITGSIKGPGAVANITPRLRGLLQ